MAQLNDLVVTGSSRFLNTINGNATTAEKVNHDLTIQLNSGSTEGTNKFTFNGSSAKTVNITASNVGALASTTTYAGSSSVGGAATSAAKLTNTAKIGDTNKPVFFTASGVPSAISYTIDKSVPSTAVFTDANVTQTATAPDANYEILFSGTADNTTRTEGVKKTSTFTFNPNQNTLLIGTLKENTTLGEYASAHGTNVQASASYAHAYGYNMVASGYGSYAGGENNSATGRCSHAEGSGTTAEGWYSHAEGRNTYAKSASQHVFGEYNVIDTSSAISGRGTYVEIVGNGTGANSLSNARTLDWSGNEVLAGNLTLSGTTSDITLSGTNNTWDGTNTSLKTAVTELVSANYLKKSGGTMTGFLALGSSAQNTLPTVGLRVHDVRNVAITPSFIERGVNFFFTNESSSTPYTSSTPWAAILHVKGWKYAYSSWEIAGPAMSGNASNTPLYVRTSNGSSSWGSWRKIYDSGNPPTTSESSIKVKKNISAISDEEVNSILKLNAVKFDFKLCKENNAIHRGFIAEDVAKILPNLVTDEVVDDDGNLVDPARLNYMEMIPYLVEVCKRQQKEIDKLKSLISEK